MLCCRFLTDATPAYGFGYLAELAHRSMRSFHSQAETFFMLAMNNSCSILVKTLRAVEGSRRGLRRVLTFVQEESQLAGMRHALTKGSGNVFRDLGFSEEKSAELILKSSLLHALQETIKERGWRQRLS